MPRLEPRDALAWLPELLAACALWAVMSFAVELPPASQRSLVFVGGPLLLLAGIHGRTRAYLHARDRLAWMPLPLPARTHFSSALRLHMLGLTRVVVVGCVALALAGGPHSPGWLLDFGWLCVFSLLVEPFVAGLSAHLGRRLEGAGEVQKSLGGGWTTPEAVVHLYGPAMALALAAALAMPGQLLFERLQAQEAVTAPGWILALAPLLLAGGARLMAGGLYGRGVWEAVPWLAEATRTLAGPPQPEQTPAWVRRMTVPLRRVVAIQALRMTPVPWARLLGVVAYGAYVSTRSAPPGAPEIAALCCLAGVWLAPFRAVSRQRSARAAMCAALPLPAAARGGSDVGAAVWAGAPIVAVAASLTARGALGW